MKKYFLYSALVALALVGCDYNEDNFEGFDDFGKPTDVKKGSFEFTDWASLSGNPKTNKYFSEKDKAQDFLPGWLASAYPRLIMALVLRLLMIIRILKQNYTINIIVLNTIS